MTEEEVKTKILPADVNGDGKVDDEEKAMYMEFKRRELEDQDAMRDSQRKMAWFALGGMLLYPFAVVLAVLFGLEQASKILGDMAATYFVAVAGICWTAATFSQRELERAPLSPLLGTVLQNKG